jgi:Retrotransposon gag protein/Zinc knuckle
MEQILSQGLTQIVSTSGSQPLTPEGPTGILSTIIHSVTNPTNIPTPSIQTQTMTTPATNQGEGGALYGAPPSTFKGDSKEADRFLLAFKGWRAVNSEKKAMMNPYSRVALILTFIDGEDVQDWKEHELDLLNERVAHGHSKLEEYLWNEFEKAFKAAFKDSSKRLNAQTQLDKLLQDREGVEQYIVKFNRLLKQAGFDEDDKGSVNLFKKGLLPPLLESCIRSQPQPVSMKEWQDTAKKEHQIFREIQHARYQRKLGQPTQTPRQKVQPNPTRFWRASGPNAMNVDLATTTEQNPCLCYNCQKPGHFKANCRSPRVQRANNQQLQKKCTFCSKNRHTVQECYALQREKTWLTQYQRPAQTQVRATETTSDAGTEQVLLTKENFKDMLLDLPDEDRATVIEEMLSQDFSGETN